MRDERIGVAIAWCGAAALTLGVSACNSLLDIEVARLGGEAGTPDAGLSSSPLGEPPLPDASAASAEPAAFAPAEAVPPLGSGAVPPAVEGAGAPGAPGANAATAMPVAPVASPSDAGVAAEAPVGPALGPDGLAVALPDDLIDAPVSGEIVFSEEASWEVDGVFQPTFEVHTPTGSYWIVKNLGTMVSLQDGYAGRLQWIDFSSGFRPLRNIPAFEAPPAAVTTVLDRESQTPTHLRLTSESSDGAWQWVWDIYITHVTFTVNRAPAPIGFSYRGVPAGSLGTEDQLIQSDGVARGARNSFSGDAPGPVEWAYLADTGAQRSLFLIQHTDDAWPERYQVRDNDSAMWVFGDGQITALPIRFSLGLLDSVDHAAVSQRVAFVAGAIH